MRHFWNWFLLGLSFQDSSSAHLFPCFPVFVVLKYLPKFLYLIHLGWAESFLFACLRQTCNCVRDLPYGILAYWLLLPPAPPLKSSTWWNFVSEGCTLPEFRAVFTLVAFVVFDHGTSPIQTCKYDPIFHYLLHDETLPSCSPVYCFSCLISC